MKAPFITCLAALSASAGWAGPFSAVSDSERLTAVSSSAHNGYVRTRLADGSYSPETFAFGKGGKIDYLDMRDPTFDDVGFKAIARMIAGPLAEQNYLPARNPDTTKLLIMVYWGTTIGGVNTRDGYLRDQVNYANAKLLGFDTEGPFQGMTDPLSDPSASFFGVSFRQKFLDNVHGDTMSAIEVNRYFVILRAFDFQTAWRQKKMKLLWETRFSLSERRHDFERDLPAMAQTASLYFGQDTYGLVMKPVPEGRVDIGRVRNLDDASEAVQEPTGDLSGIFGSWRGKGTAFMPLVVHVDPEGGSTLESPEQHWVVSAQVSKSGSDVTIKVPGWGVLFQGTLRGNNEIEGTLSKYGQRSTLTLRREMGPDTGNRTDSGGLPLR